MAAGERHADRLVLNERQTAAGTVAAHNVRPVKAAADSMTGHYTATLELEMHGEWALTLDISGPTRDRVVNKLHFGGASGESERTHEEMKDHGGDMNHGEMKMGESQWTAVLGSSAKLLTDRQR